jgi:hypothetical protein
MKYSVEMRLGVMIWAPTFTKTSSDVQNLIGRMYGHTDSTVIS